MNEEVIMDLEKRKSTDSSKAMKTETTLYDLVQQGNEHVHESHRDGAGYKENTALRNKDRIIAEMIANKFESGSIRFKNQDMLKTRYRDIFS